MAFFKREQESQNYYSINEYNEIGPCIPEKSYSFHWVPQIVHTGMIDQRPKNFCEVKASIWFPDSQEAVVLRPYFVITRGYVQLSDNFVTNKSYWFLCNRFLERLKAISMKKLWKHICLICVSMIALYDFSCNLVEQRRFWLCKIKFMCCTYLWQRWVKKAQILRCCGQYLLVRFVSIFSHRDSVEWRSFLLIFFL